MSENITQLANSTLAMLRLRAISLNLYWKDCIKNAYPETSAEKQIAKVEKLAKKLNYDDNLFRVIDKGTSVIGELTTGNVLPSQQLEIIKLLKEENRIYQIGAGKGKILIILNSDPIDNPAAQEMPKDDVEELSKLLKDRVSVIIADKEALKTQVETLKDEVEEKDKELKNLRDQIALQKKLTWN